ncbi:YcxB family protein [uncultured Erythrobacter sp.]|uniref:YcxB family protein n=1 Tax=uncultured Erythrobacter sp. TaxID=263913 RepID=UPI002624529A|nr:YcxB family protein [uncultured Erythrobacter sp.]
MEAARYKVSEEHQIAFTLLHFRASIPLFLLAGGLVTLAIAAVAYALADKFAALSVAIGGVIGVCLMLAIIRFFSIIRHAKRAYREFALIKEPVELTLSDAGFTMAQPSAHVEGRWDKMIKWDEDDEVFAIYITQQQAYVVPKDQVEPGLIHVARNGLMASGLTTKRKKRR